MRHAIAAAAYIGAVLVLAVLLLFADLEDQEPEEGVDDRA